MAIKSSGRGVDVAELSGISGMRKREHDLIDRQELEHYHRAVESIEGKKSVAARMAAEKQHRQNRLGLMLGDRTALEKFRERSSFQLVATHYDHQRVAVNEMTRDELLERRKARILQQPQTHDRGKNGGNEW